MPAQDSPPGFFARLKQHHIYRVAAAYGAAIAVLIQIVARAFPYFGWSAAVPAVIIILIAGFPVALVIAWLWVKPADAGQQTTERKRNWKLGAVVTAIVIAAVVVSGIYAFRFSAEHEARLAAAQLAAQAAIPAAAGRNTAFNPPKDSLVVLPFQNLSGDPKQQYFSDGITEELTDALGQNPALHVIAWDTASKFRDATQSAPAIGKQLNVADLLHGSIASDGNEVRVTAELVDATTDYQLWSAHYDESFKNIFAVEDAVSKAIAGALQVKFAQTDLPAAGTVNPQAHDLVLKGRALIDKKDAASLKAARRDFEQAIVLDPNYAAAHALLSHTLIRLIESSDLPLKQALPRIRAEAEKAVALDPRNADAWVAVGNADASTDTPQVAQEKAAFRKALALDPNNANAHLDYGLELPVRSAIAEEQQAVKLDPDNEIAWLNLATEYPDIGEWKQSSAAAEAAIRVNPTSVDGAFFLAYAYQHLHQHGPMVAAFDRVKPATPLDRQQVAAGRLVYQSVANPALRPQALAALDSLSRHQSNKDVADNLTIMYASLDEQAKLLSLLESLCPVDPYQCLDLAVSSRYAALRGNPRFEQLSKRYTTMTPDSQPATASSGVEP